MSDQMKNQLQEKSENIEIVDNEEVNLIVDDEETETEVEAPVVEAVVETEVEEEENNDDENSDEFKEKVSKAVEKVIGARVARESAKTKLVSDELSVLKNSYDALQVKSVENETLLKDAEKQLMIHKISSESGESFEFVDGIVQKLKGDDREELIKNALEIIGLKTQKNNKTPNLDFFDGKTYSESEADPFITGYRK